MQDNNYFEQLALKLEKKYSGYIEIYRLTKELDDVLKRNDRESIKIVMRMRVEEMDKINVINEEIEEILTLLPKDKVEVIKNYKKYSEYPQEVQKIIELTKRNNMVIEKTIEIDKVLNNRISGRKSFYGGI